MNNPYNLKPHERAITPKFAFNKGINRRMKPERRRAKQARHRANADVRRIQSAGKG